MSTPKPKPAIVLAHGVWHSPATYAKFTTALTTAGFEVYAPFLPSCAGARPPTAGLADDVLLLRRTTEILAEQGRSSIALLHSYGGVAGCSAFEGLDAASRARAGKSGGVVHILGLAAHLHPKGEGAYSLVREMGNADLLPLAIHTAEDGSCVSAAPEAALFAGLPSDEAQILLKTLSPANSAVMEAGTTYEAWKVLPVTYVKTTQDMTLPPHYQDRILEKMRAAGARIEVVEMEAGHSPYLTCTEEVVRLVEQVAGRYV